MSCNKRSDKFSKRYKFRRELSRDDTEPSMSRGWIPLNSDWYVQILLYLGCQTGLSNLCIKHHAPGFCLHLLSLLIALPAQTTATPCLQMLSWTPSHLTFNPPENPMSSIFKIHPNSSSPHHLHYHHPSPNDHHFLPVFSLYSLLTGLHTSTFAYHSFCC